MIPCNWRLLLCGVNQTSSSLEQREPLQLGRKELNAANATLADLPGVKESLILSTCNRIEFYLVADFHRKPFDIVSEFYQAFRKHDVAPLEEHFYIKKDKHAIGHLFHVTTGLDSMVLGENQIMGQAKEAYSSACANKATGKVLHRLFHQAFRIGKQVRTDTELGKGACSVSSATIDLLKTKIKPIAEPTILFIGINKMISLAVSRLNRFGYNQFIFANRTAERAVEFASRYNVYGYGLDRLPDLLEEADVIVSCTGSDGAIITDETLRPTMERRPDKKLLIADMAAPRDVELKGNYPGVDIYDLEAVQEFVKTQQSNRRKALPQAERIIENKLEQFVYWFDQIRHEPTYNGLGYAFENVRRQEMDKISEQLTEECRHLVDRATRRMIDKLLYVNARAASQADKTEKQHG